jgi:hypothetical protein
MLLCDSSYETKIGQLMFIAFLWYNLTWNVMCTCVNICCNLLLYAIACAF